MKIKKKIKKKSGSKTEILKNIQVSYEKKRVYSTGKQTGCESKQFCILYPVSNENIICWMLALVFIPYVIDRPALETILFYITLHDISPSSTFSILEHGGLDSLHLC